MFSIRVEADKTHTLWTEWLEIKGLDAERAVEIKQLCERIYSSGRRQGLSDAALAINNLPR